MSDKKKQARTYRHRTNAMCVSVYSPTGATVPAAVRREVEEAVCRIALEHKLLINIALT